ncbi:hypothetical protein BZA77DRAFT_294627 [Pyronema omphalodes]|nr:hypothetical protein BZA77DRAFT_294627 [Pyronema omphalodes]
MPWLLWLSYALTYAVRNEQANLVHALKPVHKNLSDEDNPYITVNSRGPYSNHSRKFTPYILWWPYVEVLVLEVFQRIYDKWTHGDRRKIDPLVRVFQKLAFRALIAFDLE